jgi:hypothetical protein
VWQHLHGKVIAVSSQHRFKARAYRPDPELEYIPVHDAVAGMGYCMNTLIRAFLRWVAQEPERLYLFVALIEEIHAETPRGRPRRPPD